MNVKAVISGDVVDSTTMDRSVMENILSRLEGEFQNSPLSEEIIAQEFFQGDSFQVLLSEGQRALFSALRIKTAINRISLSKRPKRGERIQYDLRLAVSLGYTDAREGIARSNEEVFVRSGRGLERIKEKECSIGIFSSVREFQREMTTSLYLWDYIMRQWSLAGVEVVYWKLGGHTEQEIADRLELSQSAVNQRSAAAAFSAWQVLNDRFQQLVKFHCE